MSHVEIESTCFLRSMLQWGVMSHFKHSRWLSFCYISLGLSLSTDVGARVYSESEQVFGGHYGYTFDVEAERNKRDVEMVMLDVPEYHQKKLSDVIFTEKLSKEFQTQYKNQFGQTLAEQVINSPGQTDEYQYYSGRNVSIQDYQAQQQAFAEYMARRLTEFHVDHWAKNDPDMRPVYEFKDRVSNLNVEVKRGYKFKWRYNFAGPNMDLSLENPYDVETRARMEMTGIVSSPTEYIYTLGYSLSPRLRISAVHRQIDGMYQLIATRSLTSNMSTSLSGSSDTTDEGANLKQNLVLLGLSWWD